MDRPASWLVENAELIPRRGPVLDVACGRGRHALWLAARGFDVHALDREPALLEALREQARALRGGRITTELLDLEKGSPAIDRSRYAAVVVINYLHRPLMPLLVEAVASGGVLIYETFTERQAQRGRPKNPAFLLQEGELPTLVAPLEVIRFREGEVEGQMKASIVAMRR